MIEYEYKERMEIQALRKLAFKHLDWHPARVRLYCELIMAVIQVGTVTHKELAKPVSTKGKLRAKISKIERFFLEQKIDYTAIGQFIKALLPPGEKLKIAIDRTNWQFGKSNLNFLVASVIYSAISIPIAWLMLDKKGNSNTKERKELIEQVLKIIPK